MHAKNARDGVAIITNLTKKENNMGKKRISIPEALKKEYGYRGYHEAAPTINYQIEFGKLPKFEHENSVQSPGKLFLIKLLMLMKEQKKKCLNKKAIKISLRDWKGLLYHYIGVRSSESILKKYIKYWTGWEGVLKKGAKDFYSLTPANRHIYKQIPLSSSCRGKKKASVTDLFLREQENSLLFEEFVEEFTEVAA